MRNKNIIDELQLSIQNSDNSIKSMQKIFYDFSKQVMNNYECQINDVIFELTEIEFYYFDKNTHCDIFTHTHDLQKNTKGVLYVHEAWGNYGGVDITFGNGDFYGGILIRGIKINSNFVAGPSKVRTELMKSLNKCFNSYTELQDFFDKNPLKIVKKENTECKVYHSTRINLGVKEADNYKYALYRFVRGDYLDESSNDIFTSRSNLKERSLLKAISSLTSSYKSNEKSTLKKIDTNDILKENIKLFNQ